MKYLLKRIFFILSLLGLSSVVHAKTMDQAIKLRSDPEYFSPNGDGLQDQTFFYPVLRSKVDVTRWTLDIRNARGKLVQRLNGGGFPALIKWEATDKKGNTIPDGHYVATLNIWSSGGRASADAHVAVDTNAPLASVSVSTTVIDSSVFQGRALTFAPQVSDDSPADRWQLQILNETGRTVRIFWSTGTPSLIAWDGSDKATGVMVPSGKYRGVFDAWDMAGNESQPAFVDLTVNVTPREMLEHVLSLIRVNQTPIGLVVQIKADDLFTFKKKRPVLTQRAGLYLREASILINAYPDAPVRLDGYCGRFKGKENQRVSSIYAWSAYNYFVKRGHVPPSRFTVRGRAKSPLFDRRAVNVPVQKDGIEIILEGNREW